MSMTALLLLILLLCVSTVLIVWSLPGKRLRKESVRPSGNSEFAKAAEYLSRTDKITDNKDKLKFYGLYKQALEGDNTTRKPTSVFDQRGRMKWEAWTAETGKSKEQASAEYVQLLSSKVPDWRDH